MEIGAIGTVQSLQSSLTKESAAKGEKSFLAFFAAASGKTPNESGNVLLTGTQTEISNEEISQLLQFLQINSMAELEGGDDLLNQLTVNGHSDLGHMLEELLGLSQGEIVSLLQNFYDQLTSSQTENKFEDTQEDYSDLYSLMQAISSLPIQGVSINLDKDTSKAFKAMKLFELLNAQEGTLDDQVRLREFLQKAGDKLEAMLKGANSSRSEFLQKTFTALAADLGESSPAKMNKSMRISNLSEHTQPHSYFQFQQISRAEQLTLVNSQSGRPVSAEQLIEQFQSILSKSHLLKNGETQRLFIKLHPEHLGALRIELIQRDSGMIARIMTSTSAAKEMIESQLHGLKHALGQQNIQVEKIEISQSLTGQERTFNKEHQQGQQSGQHQQEEKKRQQADANNQSFKDELITNIES